MCCSPTSPRQSFNHLHVLATLFEDFKRALAAATELQLQRTNALHARSTTSRAAQATTTATMTRLWAGFPCHAEFYVRFRAAFAELPLDAAVRMLLHWAPVASSAHWARVLDASYAGRVMWPSKAFVGIEALTFDAWLDTLKALSMSSDEQLELLLRMGDLIVADAVAHLASNAPGAPLAQTLRDTLKAMAVDAFCFPWMVTAAHKAYRVLLPGVVAALNRERHTAWGRVLAALCWPRNWAVLPLFQEAGKPREPEVWRSLLNGLANVRLDPGTDDSRKIVAELLSHIGSVGKKRALVPVKAQMIDTLGALLRSLGEQGLQRMWELVRDSIYLPCSVSWFEGECKPPSLRLLASILAGAPRDFRDREWSDFLATRILAPLWQKSKAYPVGALGIMVQGYDSDAVFKAVFRGLFERGKALPTALECVDELVSVVQWIVQAAPALGNTQMLPFLLHEKITVHQLVGVRVVRAGGLWGVVGACGALSADT